MRMKGVWLEQLTSLATFCHSRKVSHSGILASIHPIFLNTSGPSWCRSTSCHSGRAQTSAELGAACLTVAVSRLVAKEQASLLAVMSKEVESVANVESAALPCP